MEYAIATQCSPCRRRRPRDPIARRPHGLHIFFRHTTSHRFHLRQDARHRVIAPHRARRPLDHLSATPLRRAAAAAAATAAAAVAAAGLPARAALRAAERQRRPRRLLVRGDGGGAAGRRRHPLAAAAPTEDWVYVWRRGARCALARRSRRDWRACGASARARSGPSSLRRNRAGEVGPTSLRRKTAGKVGEARAPQRDG